MEKKFDASGNYHQSMEEIGYVAFQNATEDDYKRIGFKSGLEVHQQLKTREKLFCHCPAGKYHDHEDYDAEIVRHMRPTLSELGEYDGTALMEFKTRKEIIYRINNDSACTYEIDDTPPFKIDREALEYALEISLLSKLNIVGEVHITRKQYLDGSIPTGFQRTAILGVEGEIQLKKKKVRLIQLSLEEDSCREISDIGHTRIYKADRLGMPLIETVTYPEMETPEELKEAAEYIRFLNRSTGKVRTGIGAGREDVNVSCKGGTRVEIKGVAHNKWIPLLSHNEAFRQWALLNVRKHLNKKIENKKEWKIKHIELKQEQYKKTAEQAAQYIKGRFKLIAVNLPGFKSILSHFTQPGKVFANEISDRLKVIACIEKPNMTHSEEIDEFIAETDFGNIRKALKASEDDAQILFWCKDEDLKTALETIEERCLMAFEGVPNETRKSFEDGTTIFERVLPGADRMYPDTDSAPIPLAEEYIKELETRVPEDVHQRFSKLKEWGVPEDCYTYIMSKNLYPLIEEISEKTQSKPKFIACFFGHTLKNIEGKTQAHKDFNYSHIVQLFEFLKKEKLEFNLAKKLLAVIIEHPNMDLHSALTSVKFRKRTEEELLAPIDFLFEKFKEIRLSQEEKDATNWLMGQVRNQALGNISLKKLSEAIEKIIETTEDNTEKQ